MVDFINDITCNYCFFFFPLFVCFVVSKERRKTRIKSSQTDILFLASHISLKPNTTSVQGYVTEAATYTDDASGNCSADCLDWLCVTIRSPKYLLGTMRVVGLKT